MKWRIVLCAAVPGEHGVKLEDVLEVLYLDGPIEGVNGVLACAGMSLEQRDNPNPVRNRVRCVMVFAE